MDNKKVANEIIKLVGGKENINYLEHCSTRLRFTLKDASIADADSIAKLDGVLKVIDGAQFQVIIGTEVKVIYNEIMQVIGSFEEQETSDNSDRKIVQVILDYMISIFTPLIPAIAGAGLLKSMLTLLTLTPYVTGEGDTYNILLTISDATLYFLPIMVAYTTAKKLKINEIVAMVIVGVGILPAITGMTAEGVNLFGIEVQSISYAYQVFPAILTVFAIAPIERFFEKRTPGTIKLFFVPMMCILIVAPLMLLVLGPLGYDIGVVLSTLVISLYSKIGWIAVALLAGALPFMVATGMHKAFMPYAISQVGSTGFDPLYLPAQLGHNMSEGGMCFAVALKTKSQEKRSLAISAGISALCGITEPALYGVTLLNKKCLASVVISSIITGAFTGYMAVQAFAVNGPSLLSIAMYMDPADSNNLLYAAIAYLIAIGLSFIICLVLYKDEELAEELIEELNINTEGEIIPLELVNDDVFSTKAMGDGFAVVPSSNEVKAPYDGKVTMVFPTNHALGFVTSAGTEMLIHVGIDTVQITEPVFESLVVVNDEIKAGQPLIKFDLEKIIELGYDPTTMFIITNSAEKKVTVSEKKCTVVTGG